MQYRTERSLLVDCLKALAALLIVLHHLAFYGPMGDKVRPLVPNLWDWLADDARMAVQVFLVVAGFLCARSIAPTGMLQASLLPAARGRFLRVALPYHVVLVIALACNELARLILPHPSISAPPTFGQVLAHVLLLQDVLGYESLSAGLWYVAIDLQLFILLAVLLQIGRRAEQVLQFSRAKRPPDASTSRPPSSTSHTPVLLVAFAGLASLLYFNRDPEWEPWGVFFFGVYALGALAWWSSRDPNGGWWLVAMTACTVVALSIAFRERLVVALVVALLLGICARRRPSTEPAAAQGLQIGHPDRLVRATRWLATNSYAIFLVHFPICVVVNAVFTKSAPQTPAWQAIGIMAAVAASIAAGALFHARVESPILRRLSHRPAGAMPQAPVAS